MIFLTGMMQQLWKSFPRLLENRINQLLVEALPNSAKAFQLYKACQNENLWQGEFAKFSQHLNDFFSEALIHRSKSEFDKHLVKPMDNFVFNEFHLTFRSAEINLHSLRNIASWTHNVLRVNCKLDSEMISIDTLNKALFSLTNPGPFDKDINFEFADFCKSWKKTVVRHFGPRFEPELKVLLTDLHRLDQKSKQLTSEGLVASKVAEPLLNEAETNWILKVRRSAFAYGKILKFPVRAGPQKLILIELERMITLYSIIQMTDRPELLKHQESIRLTILDRCDFLLPQTSVK